MDVLAVVDFSLKQCSQYSASITSLMKNEVVLLEEEACESQVSVPNEYSPCRRAPLPVGPWH